MIRTALSLAAFSLICACTPLTGNTTGEQSMSFLKRAACFAGEVFVNSKDPDAKYRDPNAESQCFDL